MIIVLLMLIFVDSKNKKKETEFKFGAINELNAHDVMSKQLWILKHGNDSILKLNSIFNVFCFTKFLCFKSTILIHGDNYHKCQSVFVIYLKSNWSSLQHINIHANPIHLSINFAFKTIRLMNSFSALMIILPSASNAIRMYFINHKHELH